MPLKRIEIINIRFFLAPDRGELRASLKAL